MSCAKTWPSSRDGRRHTVFVPEHVRRYDAVVAMYHDQGLPVLKAASFGQGINVTLGLPFPRTSVDHGTALDLARDATLAKPRTLEASSRRSTSRSSSCSARDAEPDSPAPPRATLRQPDRTEGPR